MKSKTALLARRQAMARAFAASHGAEERYVRDLRGILRGVHRAYMGVALEISKGHLRQDATMWEPDLDAVGFRVLKQVAQKVEGPFQRMSGQVIRAGAEGSKKVLGVRFTDLGLDPTVASAREWSVRLVTDAARDYGQAVKDIFEDPALSGLRVEDLKDRLMEAGGISENRAELIARDQTLKLNSQVVQIRQQNAGVEDYIWSTSMDGRVRPDHAALEGEKISWTTPPVVDQVTGRREHAGRDFQCRCVPVPWIAELDG